LIQNTRNKRINRKRCNLSIWT